MDARRMILRPYQTAAVRSAVDALRGGKRPVLVSPTGSGKTVMGAAIVSAIGMPARWTAHRRELIAQAKAKLPPTCGVFAVQERRTARAHLLVVDECFPAGTLVGGRPIESISTGDVVAAFDPDERRFVPRRVVATMRRPAPETMIRFQVGSQVVTCTPNHPIWHPLDGWMPAFLLRDGDVVATITHDALHHMLKANRAEDGESTIHASARREDLLLGRVRAGVPPQSLVRDDGSHQSQARVREDDGAESDALAGNPRAHEDFASRDGVEADRPRRQRNRADRSATGSRGGARVADGSSGSDRRAAVASHASDLLQAGHRESDSQDWDRSRWELALRSQGAGREEGCHAVLARVDYVEVLQSHGDRTFGGLCRDGVVYNLEVEGLHTYEANGVAVHNCHHATSSSYRRHIDAHEGPILGLTATPFRLDGRGLGEVFDSLIVATTPAELVRDGTLVEPVYYSFGGAPASYRKRAGDFAQDEIAAAMDKPSVIGDAVTEYRERAAGTRAVAFCITVEHAHHVAAAFRDAGVPAEVVSGDMPAGERDAILGRLRDGTTKVVANCMILTEGWDLPALETAIILRPTASLCLHLQMLGRVMRSADGKRGAVVLDHAGNVLRLGFATDPVAFTLDGCPPRESSATGLRTCEGCYAIFKVGIPACPVCGRPVKSVENQTEIVVADGIGGSERLEVVTRRAESFAVQAAEWERLERERVMRDRAPGWSLYQFKNRFNEWPIVSADRRLLDPLTDEARRTFYDEMSKVMTAKGKPQAAAGMYKQRFGTWPPSSFGVKWRKQG
jgi:superfamily II DNA or RNA helicase